MSPLSQNRVAAQRPPILLTVSDRERLFALLGTAAVTASSEAAFFLREEIERADVVPDDVAPSAVVRLGCEVTFVDLSDARIRQAQIVLPEEALGSHSISVLSPIGTALIGLGPGQSIRWTDQGRERSLAVIEVGASKSGVKARRPSARFRLRLPVY